MGALRVGEGPASNIQHALSLLSQAQDAARAGVSELLSALEIARVSANEIAQSAGSSLVPPGVSEEARKLADALTSAIQNITAINQRN